MLIWVLHGSLQHRMRTDDEDASQIGITLFADRPKLLLPTRRVLSRRQSDPRREIAPRSKRRRNTSPVTGREGP